MSDEHKAALAEGRVAGRAVRTYLEALEAHQPRRGRRRTQESIQRRLAAVIEEIPAAEPLRRVTLIQERMDLERELANDGDQVDLAELQAGFVEHAASYSERKGITYAAWRELGVPPAALKAAGVPR